MLRDLGDVENRVRSALKHVPIEENGAPNGANASGWTLDFACKLLPKWGNSG